MQISKGTRVILASGISVILLAGLGMTYRNQTEEAARLKDQITATQQKADSYSTSAEQATTRQTALKTQVAELDTRTTQTKAALQQSNDAVTAAEALYRLGVKNGVAVTEIRSTGTYTQNLEKISCEVLPLSVRVEGEIPHLIAFILGASEALPGATIKSVDINIPDAGAAKKNPVATLSLTSYYYEGS